ncbi:MAG: (d)CMP kinase [Candidatus Sumerlaeaceae bacterium]
MPGNVVLIGMMGSGKTTVGKLVADRTGREFIDLDQMIVDKAGQEISEVFDALGEDAFRQMETECLREVRAATHAVIATGGGVVTRAENRRILRDLGTVFWLDAPADALLDRIGDDESRPMLRGGDPLKRLEVLQAERREHYADASNIHLDTTEFTPQELADRITQELETRGEDDTEVFNTIVAIDGPVASGKSALAKAIAERLSYVHVDTGAMYRCVTLEAMRRKVDMRDPLALTKVAHSVDIRFQEAGGTARVTDEAFGTQRVMLNGEDVTDAIRDPEVSRNTSAIADVPTVRAELVQLQREMGLRGRSVLEGRDISTVVVPEARWKVYLVASLEARVQRRYHQYELQGREVDRDELRRDVVERDERDRNRPQGALKLASDAMIFDTTDIPLDEVVDTLAGMIACCP